MALKTDFKDDVFEGNRKYRMTENEDGTVELLDVTDYKQEGDVLSADHINAANASINRLDNKLIISLPASGWTTSYPYTQTIDGLSCKDGDEPILCKTLDGTESEDTVKAYDKVFGNIFSGSIADGTATFYVKKLPETDITVCLKGVSRDE